ncbi:OLC1v1023397C1 [Oldenlandia corymbosa var. corymbosa]|uniref:OLC1v1023397C1 n=1 Tax=Oldenlandia corymbosa var. corymbosa TaxID=529605 RepID=A0AAV1C3J4_OLDCO|nr:OLC1v1023397C1 [Oldenlandia corymbosa var. corymbosa]
MNEEFSAFAGNKIGKFVEVYQDADRNCIRRLLRIKYERLTEWSYNCGIIGHVETSCPTATPGSSSNPPEYGSWLKAKGYWNPFVSKSPANEPDLFHVPDISDEEVAPWTKRQAHRISVIPNRTSHQGTNASRPTQNHNIPVDPSPSNGAPLTIDQPPLLAPTSSRYVNPQNQKGKKEVLSSADPYVNIIPVSPVSNNNLPNPNPTQLCFPSPLEPYHPLSSPRILDPVSILPTNNANRNPQSDSQPKDNPTNDPNLLSPFLVFVPMTLDTSARKAARRFTTMRWKALQTVSAQAATSNRAKRKLALDDLAGFDLQPIDVEVLGKKARFDSSPSSPSFLENLSMDGGVAESGFHPGPTQLNEYSQGSSGGLAKFWRKDLIVNLRSFSDRFIDTNVVLLGPSICITGIYGEPDVSLHRDAWNYLSSLYDPLEQPWLMFGDFNEVLSQDEFAGCRPRANWRISAFRNALEHQHLIDMGFEGYKYTSVSKSVPPYSES